MAKLFEIHLDGRFFKVSPADAETISNLKAARDSAKTDLASERTPSNMQRYADAANSLSSFVAKAAPMKRGSFASRAGKRQAAERAAALKWRR